MKAAASNHTASSGIITGRQRLWLPVLLAGFGICMMSLFLLSAVFKGDLLMEGSMLASMPWGVVSLVDIYTGLFLAGGWILWREARPVPALPWIMALVLLGNLGTCLYVLKAVLEARGNIGIFFFGAHRHYTHCSCRQCLPASQARRPCPEAHSGPGAAG